MKLSVLSVRRPVTTLMMFLTIIVLGWVSYRQLPVQLIPDISIPTVGVYMFKPGASPAEMMEKLTKPVEGTIAELPRVKEIRSWTASWGTWIQADFEYGTDIRFTTLDLQERMTSFQAGLDDRRSVIEVFPFTTDNFKNFLMELSVESNQGEEFLQDLVRDKVQPQLESISGVAKVEVGGLITPAADVEIDPTRLAGFGLEFGNVFRKIQAAGVTDTYIGSLKVPGETHYVRMDGFVKDINELSQISVDQQGIVHLEDVARITSGGAIDEWVYRANGNYAIGINVEREEGENLLQVAEKLRQRVDQVNKLMPAGTRISIETDIGEMVKEVIDEVKRLALEGALLALLVPLFFFRSWRVAAIIFVSVPVCIIAVFNMFYAAGMSINIFSIIGLAMGVGMLVDNSIVVVENCFRLFFHRRQPAKVAAERGGDEVGRALLASTLTMVVLFVPLMFIDGEFKLFIKEPAMALVFPLVISLLVALTLSVVLTQRALGTFGKPEPGAAGEKWRKAAKRIDPDSSRMREFYRFLLKGCLRHRGRVMFAIVALLALVWLEGCRSIREQSTSREGNRESIRAWVKLPPGNKTGDTSLTVGYIEAKLAKHEDIRRFSAWFRGDEANFDIQLKKPKDRPSGRSLQSIRASLPDYVGAIPGGELSLENPNRPQESLTQQATDRGELVLKGLDYAVLESFAERLINGIEVIPDITRSKIRRETDQPEIHALIDREKSKLFNISADTLGQYVGITRASGTISGLVLKDGEKQTDVTISIVSPADPTMSNVKELAVYSPLGSTVGFGELTSFRTSRTPARIERNDRQSSITIEYEWLPGADAGEILRSIRRTAAGIPNPAGIIVEFSGTQRQLEDRQKDFIFSLLAAIVLIYVVMAAVFESYWVPFTIVAANPLMIIGIVFALAITGLPFDEFAAFGVLLLNGVAVNNGIVLMDVALHLRREKGYRRLRAVFQAADQRLRPIVMTFLTTTLGLMPMALSGAEDSQWRPVAVTVVGGLTSATFLTLLVLPCFYLMGDDFVEFARPYWMKFLNFVFRAVELSFNRVTRIVMGAVSFWRWHKVPREIFNYSKEKVHFIRFKVMPFVSRWTRRFWALAVTGFKVVFKDPVYMLRSRRKSARNVVQSKGSESAIQVATTETLSPSPETPVISFSNIHVVFPVRARDVLRRYIPRKGIPLGHVPMGGVKALDGIEFEIRPGLFGLLGPNGAGKTTLMRCIAGLMEPTRGTVRLFGVAHREGGEALAPLVGYLPQNHGHYEWMTLREYLDFFAILTARTARRVHAAAVDVPHLKELYSRMDELQTPEGRAAAIGRAADEVNLTHVLDQKIGTFSGGMKQRAGIARVLLQAPSVIIVDEPTAGLDPIERVKVRVLLSQLARTRTVIFSTHIVEDLEDSCNAIAILDRGKLLYSGDPSRLREMWRDRIWEVPITGADADRVHDELLAAGARILFRHARGGVPAFRFIADVPGRSDATQSDATLEDALLGTLRAAQ